MPNSQVRRSRRRGGRSARRGGRGTITEVIPVNMKYGTNVNITLEALSTRPAKCDIRPISYRFSGPAAYVPIIANGDSVGGFVPCAVQIKVASPTGRYVAASPIKVLGSIPQDVSVAYPRSADWVAYNAAGTQSIGNVSCICLGTAGYSPSTQAYLRGMLYIKYRVGQEIDDPACPAPNYVLTNDSDEDGYVTCG